MLLLIAIGCGATAGAAQDLQPWGSAMIQSGQVATMNDAIRMSAKQARSTPPAPRNARRAKACADRPIFRAQYGADHPQVRQLDRLCAAAGY
jgi:hypothetical protein